MNIIFPSKTQFLKWLLPSKIGYIAAWVTLIGIMISLFAYFFPFRYWDTKDQYHNALLDATTEVNESIDVYYGAITVIEALADPYKTKTEMEKGKVLDDIYTQSFPKVKKFAYKYSKGGICQDSCRVLSRSFFYNFVF